MIPINSLIVQILVYPLLGVMVTRPCGYVSGYLCTLHRLGMYDAIHNQYQIPQLMNAKMRENRLDETLYIVV
jgi:hypothetical protein